MNQNDDCRVETNLEEVSHINSELNLKFFTPTISVLIDDYALLLSAVQAKDLNTIQAFLWKYGVNAVYGKPH